MPSPVACIVPLVDLHPTVGETCILCPLRYCTVTWRGVRVHAERIPLMCHLKLFNSLGWFFQYEIDSSQSGYNRLPNHRRPKSTPLHRNRCHPAPFFYNTPSMTSGIQMGDSERSVQHHKSCSSGAPSRYVQGSKASTPLCSGVWRILKIGTLFPGRSLSSPTS